MTRSSPEKLIDRLYDAAIGEECWDNTLTTLASSLGAECLVLGYGSPGAGKKPQMFTCGWDYSHLFAAGYSEEDIWDPDVNPGVAAGRYMPVAKSVEHRKLVPDEVISNSDFLQATVVKNGFYNHLLMAPYRSEDILAGGFFARTRGREFMADEVRTIDAILPHLGRALRLRIELERQRNVSQNLGEVLERLGKAVFVLDANLALLFANQAAEQMLRKASGIRSEFGRTRFPGRLQQAVQRQASGKQDFPNPEDMSIELSAGGKLMRARVYPATGFTNLPRTVSAAVVVVLEEIEKSPHLPDEQALGYIFGLTPTEATIARLVPSGKTKKQIAEVLCVSENTVKTHILSIRSKVGARSVVELAWIMAQL